MKRLPWPIVATLCSVLAGAHRMELSGGLVLGLQPVGRKSWALVHCYSEWPLRVQRDGQSGAVHSGPLYQAFLDSLCFFLSPSHNVSLSDMYTFSHTSVFFFSLSPRDPDVANLASAVRPDIVIPNSR